MSYISYLHITHFYIYTYIYTYVHIYISELGTCDATKQPSKLDFRPTTSTRAWNVWRTGGERETGMGLDGMGWLI